MARDNHEPMKTALCTIAFRERLLEYSLDIASEAGLDVLQRQPSWWEDFDDRERARLIEVDTTRTSPLAKVLEGLRSLPA